jgi:hypothetical protein
MARADTPRWRQRRRDTTPRPTHDDQHSSGGLKCCARYRCRVPLQLPTWTLTPLAAVPQTALYCFPPAISLLSVSLQRRPTRSVAAWVCSHSARAYRARRPLAPSTGWCVCVGTEPHVGGVDEEAGLTSEERQMTVTASSPAIGRSLLLSSIVSSTLAPSLDIALTRHGLPLFLLSSPADQRHDDVDLGRGAAA